MCVAVFKYLLLYDVTQALKQKIARGVSCEGEMEQRFINASKDVLE